MKSLYDEHVLFYDSHNIMFGHIKTRIMTSTVLFIKKKTRKLTNVEPYNSLEKKYHSINLT